MEVLMFGNWKERTIMGYSKGVSSTYREKQKIISRRTPVFSGGLFIEEGIIEDFWEKDITMKGEWERNQEHLIGYHYISVIRGKKDLLWVQGDILRNGNNYAVFSGSSQPLLLNWTSRKKAIKFFLESLKKDYGIELKYTPVPRWVKNKINKRGE